MIRYLFAIKMKNIIVCLVVILTCSRSKAPESKMTRHDEVLNIMRQDIITNLGKNAYWLTDEEQAELRRLNKDYFAEVKDRDSHPTLVVPGRGWELRGPLTIEQFKKESIKRYEEAADVLTKDDGTTIKFEDSRAGKTFRRFENLSQEGDEIYYFKSDECSWLYLCGEEGYVRIRNA